MMTFKALTKAAGLPLILASALLGCSGGSQVPPLAGTTNTESDIPAAETNTESVARAIQTNVSAATYHGCTVFASGDAYNADITYAATDSHSADYLASITATDNTGFYASTGVEQVNFANASTKLYTVKPQVSWHTFPVRYPVPANPYIEPGGDEHYMALLVTPPHCYLYESYLSTFNGSTFSAYSGADWDLSVAYKPLPNDTASSMASGLSLFAGMVKHEEIASGIHHALNFSMFAYSPCNCFTHPASSTGGLAYRGPKTAYEFPFGGHLRLKASFDDSKFGTQSRAIAEALKHYGMYLADTGGAYTNNNALYLANATDGGSWNAGDLSALASLRYADFDVVKMGTIIAR